jgi:hypothetical protein
VCSLCVGWQASRLTPPQPLQMNLHLWDTLMGTLSTVDDIDRQALRANKDKLRLDMAVSPVLELPIPTAHSMCDCVACVSLVNGSFLL